MPKILAIILFSYLTLSIIGLIVLFFKGELTPPVDKRPIYYFPIMLGALFSMFYVLFHGFKEFLVLIPLSLGDYNEDGGWNPTRSSIAAGLSFFTTYYFFHLIAEVDRKEEVIQRIVGNKKQAGGKGIWGWNMKERNLTSGFPNGYWLDENKDAVSVAFANKYILGVADGLMANRPIFKDLSSGYDNPDLNRDNIVDAVRSYYKKSPENKFRQIVAVMRSGCK